MVYIFVCVDFDRDYGCPLPHLKHAVSKPIHLRKPEFIDNPKKASSVRGTIEGFDFFINFLLDEKIPSTFYFEARSIRMFNELYPDKTKMFKLPLFEIGAHGYDHEDLTGEETKVVFTKQEEEEIIRKSQRNIETLFSTKILGFRAPYMRITENTNGILSKLGFVYSSSIYQESISAVRPYFIDQDLIEFPVIKTPKDCSMKGMYTYLWPLFEGNRGIDNTIENYLQIVKNSEDEISYISINLHSWHFVYNIKQDRYLSTENIVQNLNLFIKLISVLSETENVIFSTPKIWLDKHKKSLNRF